MEHIGIIGSGVAGLGCAYGLRDLARLTLLEKNDYAGGHTNTRTVDEDGTPVAIDTGFIVFNHPTYPHLTKLFAELEVPTKPAEMSFAVRHEIDNLEYNGMGLRKVFAQRSNLLRPAFWKFLGEILRFFRVARATLSEEADAPLTLREFCARHGFGREFVEWYLVPMGSAVWSTEPQDMLDFPALSLLRFFHNHGFLGVTTHHPWFTVEGGARCYVEKIQQVVGATRLQTPVRQIKETPEAVKVRTLSGEVLRFDRVIVATHADQALSMLEGADALQKQLLGAFRYQKNHATLHTWPGFMPRRRRAWAAWNFLVEPGADAASPTRATVHYWMNALQGVSRNKDYFVSLNQEGRIPAEHVLYETVYEHPVFTLEAMQAQARLPDLNRRSPRQRVFFCGSYFRYGFHEDAYGSAVDLVQNLRGLLSPPFGA